MGRWVNLYVTTWKRRRLLRIIFTILQEETEREFLSLDPSKWTSKYGFKVDRLNEYVSSGELKPYEIIPKRTIIRKMAYENIDCLHIYHKVKMLKNDSLNIKSMILI